MSFKLTIEDQQQQIKVTFLHRNLVIHQSNNFANTRVVAIVVVPARALGTSAYLQSAPAMIRVKIKREKRKQKFLEIFFKKDKVTIF